MPPVNILLVEDNRLLRWSVTSSLQREGCRVTATKSADEAIALAATARFDILITDWHLTSGYDGLDILDRVREKCPQTLAILISAEADSGLSDRARANGFNLVIEKPFPVAAIVGAVEHLTTAVRR